MERRQVKNVIIAVLLLVNGFLLALVATQYSQAFRYERSAMEQTVKVLAANGIQMDQGAVKSSRAAVSAGGSRSVVQESRLACAILGETVEGIDRGGGLFTYHGESGQVSFRSGGELLCDLADHPRWYNASPLAHSDGLMKDLRVDYVLLEDTLDGASGSVVYRQLVEKSPVFSCQVTFTYDNGRLLRVSGRLLTAEELTGTDGETISVPTALMRFLDEVRSSGDVCSAVTAVEPGFRMDQGFGGELQLKSVWHIATNTADYYVDAATGAIARSAE